MMLCVLSKEPMQMRTFHRIDHVMSLSEWLFFIHGGLYYIVICKGWMEALNAQLQRCMHVESV